MNNDTHSYTCLECVLSTHIYTRRKQFILVGGSSAVFTIYNTSGDVKPRFVRFSMNKLETQNETTTKKINK